MNATSTAELSQMAIQASRGETQLERELAASLLLVAVTQARTAVDVLTAEVVRLKAIEAAVKSMVARPVTDCGVLGCDQSACKGDIFNHRREIDDFGNLLPEASR